MFLLHREHDFPHASFSPCMTHYCMDALFIGVSDSKVHDLMIAPEKLLLTQNRTETFCLYARACIILIISVSHERYNAFDKYIDK